MRRSPPVPRLSWRRDPARAALLAIYAEVDRLLVDVVCDASTECCRFGITGREPYPTAVELAEVRHAAAAATPARDGADDGAARRRRGLPIAADGERRCPLLSAEGRCRIYASRPFGCRTFFCARATRPGKEPRAEIQRLSRAIADLSARAFPDDPLPRPLTRALAAPR